MQEEENRKKAESLKLAIEEYERRLGERGGLEAQYKVSVREATQQLLAAAIKRFEWYTQDEVARAAYLQQVESLENIPFFRLR